MAVLAIPVEMQVEEVIAFAVDEPPAGPGVKRALADVVAEVRKAGTP